MEHTSSPNVDDPELLERLKDYVDLDIKDNRQRLSQYLIHIAKHSGRQWTMTDFKFQDQIKSHDDEEDEAPEAVDEGKRSLYYLTIEFLGYLRCKEAVPYTKGELARYNIQQYILDRYSGRLEPRRSLLEEMFEPNNPKPKPRLPDHLLCPDRRTLECYLAQLLDFLNPQYYKAVATLELIPAWMRFLESRHLIDSEQRKKTLRSLSGLDTELLERVRDYRADPTLAEGIRRWPENAIREHDFVDQKPIYRSQNSSR